jgi:hypothetical protein
MRWLLLGYMFLFIHRPFEVWPILGTVRLELCYALMTGGLWLFSGEKRWVGDRLHWAFGAFAVAVVLCFIASPYTRVYRPDTEDYLKICFCYLMLVTLMHDERHLKFVILGFLAIMTVYMGHSLFEYVNGRHAFRMSIVRLLGIDKTLGDPNHFAHSIVYTLPFVVPTWFAARSMLTRSCLCGYVALACVCIALTGSRSALLGVAFVVFVTVLRTRYRLAMIVLVVAASPLMWFALPPSLQNRFMTIVDPSVGPKSAKDSGDGRFQAPAIGAELFQKHPLTGVGPGYWIPATRRKVQSHHLYAQVMGEMGLLGIVTFAAILVLLWLKVRGLKKEYKAHPEWGRDYVFHVIQAVSLGILLMLFLGNTLHNLFRFNWLWYGAFLIVAGQCVRQRLQGAEPPYQPAAYAPAWAGHA